MTVDIHQQINEEISIDASQKVATQVAASAIQAAAVQLVATQLAATITVEAHLAASQTKPDKPVLAPIDLDKPQTAPDREIPNRKPNYARDFFRAQMEALLAEILMQLEELERTGYSNWLIISIVINKLQMYAAQLKADVIDPLRDLQGIDRAHSKLKAIIEKISAKSARREEITEEDAKEFADAVKELDDAVNEALEKMPERKDGDKPTPYEDLIYRLKENIDMILKQGLQDDDQGRTIEDVLNNPKELIASLRRWGREASDNNNGPFIRWNEGRSGLTTLGLELQSMVTEYSDRLNRDSQLITSLNSMGQKQVELVFALLRTLTANQISR